MTCNLPEFLAHDLEMSEPLFQSRCMTAGAPSLPMTSSGRERSQSMRSNISRRWVVSHNDPLQDGLQTQKTIDVQDFPAEHTETLKSGSPPRTRYHKGEFRMREEENGGRLVLDLDYEENSDSKTDSSTDAASPSIRTRQRSVTTTATSVNSARCSSSSHKPHVSMSRVDGSSWVDLEPDIWDSEPALNLERPLTAGSPSKRPHTSSGAPSPQKRISEHSIIHVPKRRSSLSHRVTYLAPGDPSFSRPNSGLISFAPLPDLSFDSNAFQQYSHRRNISSISRHPDDCFEDEAAVGPVVSTHRLPVEREVNPPSPPRSVAEEDHVADLPQTRESELHEKPALPKKDMPGLINVQAWLESSGELAVASPLRVKQTPPSPGIRVPPEIMETLRVSITNFPETMLLTSSLTIETIRSYSKKLKRSSSRGSIEAPFSIPSVPTPPSPTATTKRWKFSKLLSSRFGNGSSKSNSPARDDDSSNGLDFGSTASATSTPNWAPIRNIFPHGSDYLCDALYAHLLAYNYLASICPIDCSGAREKHIRVTKAGLDNDGYPVVDEDPRRVPKKAASLLGLSRAAACSTTDVFQIPRKPVGKQHKRLLSLGGDKKGTTVGPESTLADLRDGLAKCIANLVSTLKLTGGGEQDAPIMTDGLKDLDPLLLRSLCEVVRCYEV